MGQESYLLAKNEAVKSLLMTFAIGLWIYWLWSRRHLYWFALKVPGLLGLPFLGIFVIRVLSVKKIFEVFEEIFKACKSYTVCIWMGSQATLLTSDPQIVEKVLTSNFLLNKASFYRSFFDIYGGSILWDPTKFWRCNRKIVLLSFNQKILLGFFPVFHKAKITAVTTFDNMIGRGEQKICALIRRIVLGISLETTFGHVMQEGVKADDELCQNLDKMVEFSMTSAVLSYFHLDHIWRHYVPFERVVRRNLQYQSKLILEKFKIRGAGRTYTESGGKSPNDMDQQDSQLNIEKTHTTYLDNAFNAFEREKFKWTDIFNEAGTLIAASFETSAGAIAGAIIMLAMHPEYQERLFKEIFDLYPEKNFEMKHEDIKHLPYLTMIINETLRLVPPAPLLGRRVVDRDVELTKDLLLPQDLDIMIDVFNLHRRRDIWGPNADKFYPDHFLPENLRDKHAYAFIPFSKGPRNCVGYQYAYHSMRVLLAGLVRNFKFSTTFKYEDLHFHDDITIKFTKEPAIQVQRREV